MAALDSSVATVAPVPESGKSFAQVLSTSRDVHLTQLPTKVIMGTSVRIRITQAEYECGLAACRFNLHGRLTLHKGDSPVTTQALKLKLNSLWPQLKD